MNTLKDSITGEKQLEKYYYKTLDNKPILISTFNNVCYDLDKSRFTLKEATDSYNNYNSFIQELTNSIIIIKKLSELTNMSKLEWLYCLMDKEQELSIKYYNKYRQCLTIKEHTNILLEAIELLIVESKQYNVRSYCLKQQHRGSNINNDLKKKYLKGYQYYIN